ncbi:AraC family transcriptional regulator [Pseudonocardia endophytica]|uniref:AraC-like DNA-binding protein n=1 Tax=Pseudonocardia endophytica TaxID=401976 RepID=A0A4R1HUC3_PSEEN|nr:AraC family transcriptional regulator [Pseudonocardia endophytica]TCK26294.1 AraC-like DNA-binding protein [Pseudonocardia endophytica]
MNSSGAMVNLASAPLGSRLIETDDVESMVDELGTMMAEASVKASRVKEVGGVVDGLEADGLSMMRITYGDARIRLDAIHDPAVDDYLAISLPVVGGMSVDYKGASFRSAVDSSAFIKSPGGQLTLELEPGVTYVMIMLAMSDVRRFAARTVAPEDETYGLDFHSELSSSVVVDTLVNQAEFLRNLANAPHDLGNRGLSAMQAVLLREQIMTTLLLGHDHSLRGQMERRERRQGKRSAILDAASLMSARAGQAIGVEFIAREVGLSMRGLHAGFRREFDQSPKQFLTRLRMERARADLEVGVEAGDAQLRIADVARRWGYPQANRFAAVYREHFGELPSATIARSHSVNARRAVFTRVVCDRPGDGRVETS